MLPGFYVPLRLGATACLAHYIEYVLPQMAFDRPAGFVLSALFPESAHGANLLGCSVIPALPVHMQ